MTKLAAEQKRDVNDFGVVKRSGLFQLLSTVGILLVALLLAVLIISFVFRSYQVSGESMESTLHNTDKLIIWKVPRTLARITHNDYIPSRGDIIIFSENDLAACNQLEAKQLIKRVIGLPGDRVVARNGVYTVFDKLHTEGFDPDKSLPYGNNISLTPGNVDVTLKANQVFVSGDNRPNSCDSRNFGPVSVDQVIGKLIVKVFPINQIKIF